MLKEKTVNEILNSTLKRDGIFLYGNYRNFNITITESNNFQLQLLVKIFTHINSENKEELTTLLQNKRQDLKNILEIGIKDNSIDLLVNPLVEQYVPSTINKIVDAIIDYLQENNYISGCEMCGNAENTSFYKINDNYSYLCNKCIHSVNSQLEDYKQEKLEQSSDLLLGILGAFIGSILGCIVWLIIFKLGYVASFAGLVIGIGALKGYEKLGKTLDKKGVIATIFVIIVSVFFVNKFAWATSAYSELKEYLTFFECYSGLNELLEYSELTSSYNESLVMGYVMTAIGCFTLIKNAFKSSTGNYSITKKD